MTKNPEKAPKNQDDDCGLVTTTAPLHLNQNQLQLFEWAKSDRVDAIRDLIAEHRCNLNVQDNYNRTPLHFAASSGNLATVKLLVQNNAVIDVNDKYGITPLLWSVYNNHKKVAVFLIENGAKYNKVTKQGHTIVHFVAESNAIGILKYLYHKYHLLEVDKRDNAGLTPFMVAAFRGNELLLEVFIRQKCCVTTKDKKQRSALHLASWKGHMAVVNHLIKIPELVAMIDDLDADGKSPLHYAVMENHQEVVRRLLIAGANTNVQSSTYDAPIIETSRRGYHSCIDILLAHGADKDVRTKNGNGAIHAAAMANLPDTIYFQVVRGFDLHAENDRGQTPLHLAVEQNRLESVEALLLAGSKLNLKDKDGLVPLEVAARASYTTLVDMIIKTDRWRQQHPDQVEAVRVRLLHIPEASQSSQTQNTPRDFYSEYDRPYSFNASGSINEWPPGQSMSSERISNSTTATNRNDVSGRAYNSSDYHTPAGSVIRGTDSSQSHSSNRESKATLSAYPTQPTEEFIDPFAFLPDEEEQRDRTPASNCASPMASYAESELSLGLEASRLWDQIRVSSRMGHPGSPEDQTRGRISSTDRSFGSIRGSNHPSRSHDDGEAEDDDDEYSDRIRISGEERILPNGEIIVSLYDNQTGDPSKSGSSHNVLNDFSLLTYDQPHAEEIKVMLFELAHKELKPDDWKKLAAFWGFHQEHIAAIEYQDSGKNSYKEHGYRVLSIWLHGVDRSKSPVNEIYMALIGIGRNKLARKLRSQVEQAKKKKGCRVQ